MIFMFLFVITIIFPYMKSVQYIHNILTSHYWPKISICRITVLLTSQQFIKLLPTIKLLTNGLIFIGPISHVILMSKCLGVVQILGLDGQGYWKHWYVSEKSEKNFFEKMKVYSKAVIDWLLGQQQYCLTLKYICALDQSAA